mmetsp:Transcript_5587/g.17558  ORF Transcript_5587/g.17558 Transcript_5587/m.17558 type:complete len:314 (-) Transcript_5587:42-983(-)
MVELRAARDRREHAALVQLEGRAVRLDRDGDGLARDRRLERRLVLARHVGEAGDGDGRRAPALVGRAARRVPATRHVRVLRLGADPVLLDELEGLVHQPTAAPVLRTIARDELLLGERDERARRDAVGALDRARRREGPARAARALVLDRRHAALGHPVDIRWQPVVGRGGRGGGDHAHAALLGAGGQLEAAQVLGGELLPRHVRELVVPESVRVRLRIVRRDDVVVLDKPRERDRLGVGACVHLAVLGLVLLERALVVVRVARQRRRQRALDRHERRRVDRRPIGHAGDERGKRRERPETHVWRRGARVAAG